MTPAHLADTPAGGGTFDERLRRRHDRMWRHRGLSPHKWIFCRHTYLSRRDPIERWRCCDDWQRRLTNKWNSRELAQKLGIPVPELYWAGTRLSDIPFAHLPPRYVVRSVVGYSARAVLVVSEGRNLLDGRACIPATIRATMQRHVRGIPPRRVLVEEFIPPEPSTPGILPREYKFLMFGEHVGLISVIDRRPVKQNTVFDAAWNIMPPIVDGVPRTADPPPRPACLDEMLAAARTFGGVVGSFVRVDMYAGPRGAVFGETTGTPNVGGAFSEFADRYLAECWDRYCPGTP